MFFRELPAGVPGATGCYNLIALNKRKGFLAAEKKTGIRKDEVFYIFAIILGLADWHTYQAGEGGTDDRFGAFKTDGLSTILHGLQESKCIHRITDRY